MNEVYKKLDEAKDICIDKMERTSDPEEFERYSNQLVKITNTMTEMKKLEKEDKLDIKFIITAVVPLITMIIGKGIEWMMWWKAAKELCYFERENTFTTSAGKGLARSVAIPSIISRDR